MRHVIKAGLEGNFTDAQGADQQQFLRPFQSFGFDVIGRRILKYFDELTIEGRQSHVCQLSKILHRNS